MEHVHAHQRARLRPHHRPRHARPRSRPTRRCSARTSAPRRRRHDLARSDLGRPTRAGAIPVLELAAVRAGYGRIDVLHGVDLDARRRARSSRCSARTARASRRRSPSRRARSRRPRAACCCAAATSPASTARRARPRRRVPDPRRPGHLPEPHGDREPAHGDVHRALAISDVLDRAVRAVPPPRRAAQADRGHAVGRRAADARRWPGRSRPTPPSC